MLEVNSKFVAAEVKRQRFQILQEICLDELSNRHAAPTELEDQGGVPAIDMALLRSFSRRFIVPIRVSTFARTFAHAGFFVVLVAGLIDH
jgi:hypothetical protein